MFRRLSLFKNLAYSSFNLFCKITKLSTVDMLKFYFKSTKRSNKSSYLTSLLDQVKRSTLVLAL